MNGAANGSARTVQQRTVRQRTGQARIRSCERAVWQMAHTALGRQQTAQVMPACTGSSPDAASQMR
jgi:hypothetical protein